MKNKMVLKPVKRSIVAETAGSLKKYVHPSKLRIPFKKVREETQRIAGRYIASEGLG